MSTFMIGDMCRWLKHFKTFETYVDYFILNDFVGCIDGKYCPIDLFTGEIIDDTVWEEYKADKYKYIQKKASIQELELFFRNLKERTLSRSKSIHKLVDK